MPNPNLSDQDITNVIAFLTWVSHIDNQGWPPRPILVRGDAAGRQLGGGAPQAASSAIRSLSARRCSDGRRRPVSAATPCSRA